MFSPLSVCRYALLGGILSFAAFSFAVAVQAAPLGDPALAAGLVPHKALYDIKLVETRSGSQIVNIRGNMLYEWQTSCEQAWTSKHRFDLIYEYADGPAMRVTSDFSTYENFNGEEMSFTSERKREGSIIEQLRGQATLNKDADGIARYSIPQNLEQDIPQGAVFPMGHTLGLLEHIKNNQTFYNATMFDGSDADGPVNINAFIGKSLGSIKNTQQSKAIDQTLLDADARNIQLAFFPLKSAEETAEYEMSVVFHENGVISSMLIKYDDFSVIQTLKALEPLKVSKCDLGR